MAVVVIAEVCEPCACWIMRTPSLQQEKTRPSNSGHSVVKEMEVQGDEIILIVKIFDNFQLLHVVHISYLYLCTTL